MRESNSMPSPAILLVIGVAVLLGVYVLQIFNMSKLSKDQRLAMSGSLEDISVIVLGDSTEENAIDSSVLGPHCINLAIAGSGYSTWEPIFTSIGENLPKGKVLLISADPMSALRDGLGPRGNDCGDLLEKGVHLNKLSHLTSTEKVDNYIRYRSIISPVISGSKLSMDECIKASRKLSILPKKNPYKFKNTEGKAKKRAYLDWLGNSKHVEENMASLRHILTQAMKLNLEVVFVRTPVTEEFYQEGKDEWEKWFMEILNRASDIVPQEKMKILDLKVDNRFGFEHFADPNHLNASGKKLFSAILHDQLNLESN